MVMQKKKGLPKIRVEYEAEVRDKNGKLISQIKGESHSFVKNFLRFLRALWGATTVTITNTGGGTASIRGTWYQSAPSTNFPFDANAGLGTDAYGIQVGSSDAPFSRDNYSLGSKISHGTGSGQLVYGAMSFEDVADADGSSYLRLTRTFTNNSGASVTVKEIGIALRQSIYADSTYYLIYFLIARDVLTSPSSVPDGATFTVRYRIQISY
jgi:hypothetical protein